MNFPLFSDNNRLKAFTSGWSKATGPFATPDLYWNPRSGTWETYLSTRNTISDIGIPSPKWPYFISAEDAYKRVEQSWAEIRATYPNVYFDPMAHEWRVIVARPAPDPQRPAQDDYAKREASAKEELDRVDRQYQKGILNADEHARARKEIRQKYRL